MELSKRERQILIEIEAGLMRRDRVLAHRFDALEAVGSRPGPQRFACQVSLLEILIVLLATIVVVTLPVLLILSV